MSSSTRRAVMWLTAIASVALLTAAGHALDLNPTTAGFAFLILVLLLSVRVGLLIGTVSSVLATLCYNFFFFPPFYTLTLEDPANWFALAAFLATSVTVSRLVVAARVQAERAQARRNELETLYGLSIDLFTATNRVGAMGEAAGRALQLLGARAGGLVLFDGSSYRQKVIWWNVRSPMRSRI